jgi:hypothetical protein
MAVGHCKTIALALGLIVALSLAAPRGLAEPVGEYSVKAAFLLNFARLIQWPNESFEGPKAPIVVGFFGADAFEAARAAGIDQKRVGARPVEIRHISRASEASLCHLVFLSDGEGTGPESLLEATRESRVLTVSEIDGFAGQGGIINFYRDGKKVRFEINTDAAKKRGFRISSRLLGLAKIVSGNGS